jgi:cobalamin biosynthesis protein CbiM/cobalt ECF transporter T component CbiQ
MHISEGFLPLSHCIAWGAASLGPVVVSVRAISKELDRKRENRVLLAASAAFLFTLTALRMPSLTGSSSHPTGTAVGTYLFGPSAMPALALITLVFQALLLAHGGLTTLGANLFSLGVIGPWAMWIVLRMLLRMGWKRDRCIFLSTVVGDLATYVTTACQLALAYPSAHGGYSASFVKFLGVFLITQIPISIAEGLLTVVLLRSLAADQGVGLQGAMEGAVEGAGEYSPTPTKARFASANMVVLFAVFGTMIGAFLYANYTKPLGSDDQAVSAIQNLRPNIRPIAKPLFTPSAALEPVLFTLQAAIGVAILIWAVSWFRGRHRKPQPGGARHLHLHPHLSDIAFTNAWRHRNPWEKVLFGGGLLLVSFFVAPFPWCIAIAVIVTLAAIAGAKIPVSSWLGVLSIPVSFAIITALGILLQINHSAGGFSLAFDWNGLPLAAGLLLRSTAAISCLAFIGWTTPLMELTPVFQRVGFPVVLIDLALMIYRFLFVTATTLGEMRRAQSWRLGRADYSSRMRALSMLAGGLFLRCVQRARRLEEGIEARGYQGRLWVLAPRTAASPFTIAAILLLQVALLVAGHLTKGVSWL